MIFNWFKPRPYKLQYPTPTWEYSEKPIYDHEADHRETMQIIEDILKKLDEIKILVDEMKNE
jgi:hypothetical protein